MLARMLALLLPLALAEIPMELTSPAFDSGATIPKRYTCEGANVSPPLAWSADMVETSDGTRTRWVCPECTRRFVRAIEAKLDQQWW